MKKLKTFFKTLKTFDMFGKPITLTMNNKDTFKTVLGGLISCSFKLFFLVFAIYSLYTLFSQKNLSSIQSVHDLGFSYGSFPLDEKTFNLALKFDSSILNNWVRPFVNISFSHVIKFRNNSLTEKKIENIALKPCNKTNFPGLESEFTYLNLAEALCLSPNSNLTIEANFLENVFSYFQISVFSCIDSNVCQNDDTIRSTLKNIGLLIEISMI